MLKAGVAGTGAIVGVPVVRIVTRCCSATACFLFAPISTRASTRAVLPGRSMRRAVRGSATLAPFRQTANSPLGWSG